MPSKQTKHKIDSPSKIAASALAIGAGLGIGQTANAGMIYVDPVDDGPFGYNSQTDNMTVDINGDGTNDFNFSHYFRPQGYCGYGCYIKHRGYSTIQGLSGNGVLRGPQPKGADIGSGNGFRTSTGLGSVFYYSDTGDFPGGTEGLIGLEFDIAGENHYGWARVSIGGYYATATLLDYAYSDIAGQRVIAGSVVPLPAAAPLLAAALGALGVSGFRRRKRELKVQRDAEASAA